MTQTRWTNAPPRLKAGATPSAAGVNAQQTSGALTVGITSASLQTTRARYWQPSTGALRRMHALDAVRVMQIVACATVTARITLAMRASSLHAVPGWAARRINALAKELAICSQGCAAATLGLL